MTKPTASQTEHAHTEQCALLLRMLCLPLTYRLALARAAGVIASRHESSCHPAATMSFVPMRQHASGSGRTGPGRRLLSGVQWDSGWAVSRCGQLPQFPTVQRNLMPTGQSRSPMPLLCRVFLHRSVHGPDSCQLGVHCHHPTDLQPHHL